MILTDFLTHLKNVKRNGNQFTTLCPAHDDSRNSLSVSQNGSKILLNCFAGCQPENICSSIGLELKDLFYDSQPNRYKTHSKAGPQDKPKEIKREEICAYDYRDESGDLLYQNVRYLIAFENGTTDKDFKARRIEDGRHIWNLDNVRRVPYRLPELIAALEQNPNCFVFLTEGEKDAENVRALDLTGSSFKNWKPEFSSFIAGANVVLFVDHDKSGIRQATDAAQNIKGVAASLRLVDLYADEPLPEKHGKDISDWLETHYRDELQEIIRNAPLWIPNKEQKTNSESAVFSDNEPKLILPELSRGALYGLAGDFVRAVEPHTEAHEAGLLFQFLTAFGNAAGKSAYMITDGSKQYLNLFLLLIGKTGKQGRKGTALSHVLNLFEAVAEDWTKRRILNGLASGQGLIHSIRDAKFKMDKNGNRINKDGEEICLDTGEADKRLLCVEEEFAAVLKMQGIENSTLSAVLRSAWDGKPLGNISRQNSERCLNPHVSLIGHITPYEFDLLRNDVDLSNGYLNRFILSYVWRSKILPEGGTVSQNELNDLIKRTRDALEFAGTVTEMKRDDSARDVWHDAYRKFNEQICIGLIGDVLSRAEAQVTRLSMLFAVLDHSNVIQCKHLEAALKIWQYCEDAAGFIFRGRIGDKAADKILEALRAAYPEGMSQSRLYELFDRHITKAVLESKLIMLLEAGLVRNESQQTATKQAIVWYAQMQIGSERCE